jgi:quercetin dioxygenase-like cupin family protein
MGAFDNIRRVIVPAGRYASTEIAPGVLLEQLHPGGKEGPNREIHFDTPGGQAWSEYVLVGDPADPFQILVPDVRMPANQLWPLHWHDTWTVVLVLEGQCVLGDWYMQPGDVFIAAPGLEYGPLLIGPHGCRLLEIFARGHLADGGYSPEYSDHPTLQGGARAFKPREPVNQRNNGQQLLPVDGVDGMFKSRMEAGREWDLGESGDPERGLMRDTRLLPGEAIEAHSHADWHFMMVLEGSLTIGERKVERDGYVLARPGSVIDRIEAGAGGVQILELARTAAGMERRQA